MIDKRAIKAFLERKLSNFDWLKKEPVEVLDEALAQLDPVPDFGGVTLRLHQKACFLIINDLKRFLLLLDMGAGKTVLSLLTIKYQKQQGKFIKAIVFVPYLTSVVTWLDECEKHTPDLRCVPLSGTTAENLETLKTVDADLYVICYQSAVAMLAEKTKAIDSKGKLKTKWQVTASGVAKVFGRFNMLVCDEIHKCKDHTSLTYRMCRTISSRAEWVLGLTGTPFGKNPESLWAQFYLIDFGETLGKTLGLFREAFFKAKLNYWGGVDWQFNKKRSKDLKRILKNKSIRYELDEFADMPPLNFVRHYVPQPPEGGGYCKASISALRKADDYSGQERYQHIESTYLQLRQLSSGFLTLKGEDTERLQLDFKTKPKLEALLGLLESIPDDKKVVVFHHFVYSNKLITGELAKAKIKHASIWGGQRDKVGQLRKFQTDPNCRVLVINSRSGSSSLNLQFASYMIFFECPDSPIDRQQAVARIYRPGQQHHVMVYDLITRGTLDEGILDACQNGKNLLDKLLGKS